MRSLAFVVVFSLFATLAAAGHAGSHAEYIGGTYADLPAKNPGDIEVSDRVYFVFASRNTRVKVPFERINLLEYGQKVDRRYLAAIVISPLLMLSTLR